MRKLIASEFRRLPKVLDSGLISSTSGLNVLCYFLAKQKVGG